MLHVCGKGVGTENKDFLNLNFGYLCPDARHEGAYVSGGLVRRFPKFCNR
jgi:hypothetical protein